MAISIRQAQTSDVGVVAELAHALLSELTPPEAEPPKIGEVRASVTTLLNKDRGIWAFLAEDERGHTVGVLTLHECASIYAGGRFGEISELFVIPRHVRKVLGLSCLRKRYDSVTQWNGGDWRWAPPTFPGGTVPFRSISETVSKKSAQG